MNQNAASEQPLNWQQLEALPDAEISALVKAAFSVLKGNAENDAASEITDMPPSALSQELQAELNLAGMQADNAQTTQLVKDEKSSRDLALLLLRRIAQEPGLAAEVEKTYRAQRQMMAIDPFTVAAVALLILALKVKDVEIGEKGTKVSFHEWKKGMLVELGGLLGLG